jgi:hypothetical protein
VDAAPTNTLEYFVGGTLTYAQDGQNVTVPLTPTSITVLPLAQLNVKYFHDRDVFSDDPFTSVIEPSIPFNLAVMIENTGYGVAKNVRITSAQPKIVENESGLLIDFNIIGTEVSGQNLTPSLTADFGTITNSEIKVGRWLLKSTLQGLFIDYKASFEHLDGLGNKRIAIITNVEIHEMIHLVKDVRPGADTLPDFLVNDITDVDDMPDTIYLSDGRIEPVSVLKQATVDATVGPGSYQVKLTANMPDGWTYLLIPDPGNGIHHLTRVTRADGRDLPIGTNAWTTDRTFIGQGQRPIRENNLHLLDYNGGVYTLYYDAPASQDVVAPVSSMLPLPGSSYPLIPVNWSGQDEVNGSGVAFFDVFVSVDGGTFLPWLQRTTLRSSVYTGNPGSRYAFYTVATDNAGNREPAPSTPQAETTVSQVSYAPVIPATYSFTLDEGQTLDVAVHATDADVPEQKLTYQLDADALPGLTLNSDNGQINWITTEATGPNTYRFHVIVTDNGFPPLSATSLVTVVVREINTAPSLAPISNLVVNEGALILITNVVVDPDLPRNPLTFTLGSGAPQGATINSVGVFRWQPNDTQGPSTNRLSVMVNDNGVPPLSATQQFTIVVRDVRNEVVIVAGRTNVMVGESNFVPIILQSILDLTEVSVTLDTVENRLGSLGLSTPGNGVISLALLPQGGGRYVAQFTMDPAQSITGPRVIAHLDFVATLNIHSAIVPLTLSKPVARRTDGGLGRATTRSGRVIVVGSEPVLDMESVANANQVVSPWLVVYGHPGVQCVVLGKPDVDTTQWEEQKRFLITDRIMRMPAPLAGQWAFFKAYEIQTQDGELVLKRGTAPAMSLLLYAETGGHYTVFTTLNVADPIASWLPAYDFIATNGEHWLSWTNHGEATRFFRAIKH